MGEGLSDNESQDLLKLSRQLFFFFNSHIFYSLFTPSQSLPHALSFYINNKTAALALSYSGTRVLLSPETVCKITR